VVLREAIRPTIFTLTPMTFGLFEDNHHPRIPLDHLVENQARLDAHKLNLVGALTQATITELRWGEIPYRLAARTVDILVNGNPFLVLWDELARPYFACPKCACAASTSISTSLPAESAAISTIQVVTCIDRCLAFTGSGAGDDSSASTQSS